jgi:uncharacterized protein YbaA (DUF1428 family)
MAYIDGFVAAVSTANKESTATMPPGWPSS